MGFLPTDVAEGVIKPRRHSSVVFIQHALAIASGRRNSLLLGKDAIF